MVGNIRKQTFLEELNAMKSLNYINTDEYENLWKTYLKFDTDRNSYLEKHKVQPFKKEKEVIPRKVLSLREVRDRNITWILAIGVVMVLLSGLLLATSNWNMLSSLVKTIIIALVAILFFGTSITADRVLDIKKTSFAFWVLGSLFLPVAILSAGYFQLFGSFLSLFGHGKYLLGSAGAAFCIPVYIYSTIKYKNRLFSWFTLFFLSIGVCFIISAFYPSVDIFYFGITVYNGILLTVYERLKKISHLKIFMLELPLFTQVNIIISTLFLLAFYNNPGIYGFNIILTSILYISMVFSRGRREYSLVFSALLVYGIYEIVEHTGVESLDLLLFSLVGFVFIGIEYGLKSDENLKRIFRYVSAFVSFCAFIFISLKGMKIREGQSSLLMLVSYLLISINYIYLSWRTKRKLFSYLAPVFLIPAGNQAYAALHNYWINYDYSIHMFITGGLIFFGLYYKVKWEYTKEVKNSSLIISVIIMLYSALLAVINEKWIYVIILFYIFAGILYLIYKSAYSNAARNMAKWSIPVSLLTGSAAIFDSINRHYNSRVYTFAFHFMICLFIMLLLSIILRKYMVEMESPFFHVPHIIMPLSVLLLLVEASLYSEFRAVPFTLAVLMIFQVYSVLRFREGFRNIVFMYLLFLTFALTLSTSFTALKIQDEWQYYVMLITSIAVSIYWYLSKGRDKKAIAGFLIPFSIIGAYLLNYLANYNSYGVLEFVAAVLYTILILFVNYKSGWRILDPLPLILLLISTITLRNEVLNTGNQMIILLAVICILLCTSGILLSKRLFDFKKGFFIDWYSLFGAVSILMVPFSLTRDSQIYLKMLAPVFVSAFFFLQVNRVGEGLERKIALTIAYISILYPYYTFLNDIKPWYIISTEMYSLPWIVLAAALSRKAWGEFRRAAGSVEMAVLLIVSAVLFKDILSHYYMEDGLIMGVLSLCAIIAGMQLKIKSYFIVGTGTLLLNLLIQTREFWKSIPWWVYLLAAGLILIITASLNEMQKNGKEKGIRIKSRDIINKFKKWK